MDFTPGDINAHAGPGSGWELRLGPAFPEAMSVLTDDVSMMISAFLEQVIEIEAV